jgi:adenylate cyclase
MRLPAWLVPAFVLMAAIWGNLAEPDLLRALRHAVFDEYQRIKPAPWEDAGVRIVDIDEESLARIGQWPWPRTRLAELLGRLGELGVGVVAFDVVFAEPDRTSPRHVVSSWRGAIEPDRLEELVARLPDHDAAFAAALAEVPSVLGVVFHAESTARIPATKWGMGHAGDDPLPFLPLFSGATANLPELEAAAAGQGSFTMIPDGDQVIRRVPLLVAMQRPGAQPVIYPALGLEALRVLQGASTYVLRASNASGQTAFGERTGLNAVRIGRAVVPTDRDGRMWLRDTGPVPQRYVPAWKVLAGEVPALALDGAIVFVGTSAPGLKDLRALPLNPLAAGVEVHARITEQILHGVFLARPDWLRGAEVVGLILVGALLIAMLPRLGPVWCAFGGAVAIAGSFAASWFAFDRLGLLADPVFPALTVLSIYVVSSLIAFLRTERERRWVRSTFGQYLSPALVEELARDPTKLRLGGDTRDMTILFSDIRGFTSRSEKLSAAELARFINGFLTPMTALILERRGYIDKYMGDAIMAFWGAPLANDRHHLDAARSALAMVAELERLNERWAAEAAAQGTDFEPVAIGIGLNAGEVSVGNFGADQHFSYSVIGDEVNLASRLEGRSKSYGVTIVIGENLARRLEGWAVLELDRVRVKGKAKPVAVFTLLSEDGAELRDLTARHAAMLARYRAQDWDAAEEAVAGLEGEPAARPLLELYALYRARIAALRATPPPDGWDGVEVAVEK